MFKFFLRVRKFYAHDYKRDGERNRDYRSENNRERDSRGVRFLRRYINVDGCVRSETFVRRSLLFRLSDGFIQFFEFVENYEFVGNRRFFVGVKSVVNRFLLFKSGKLRLIRVVLSVTSVVFSRLLTTLYESLSEETNESTLSDGILSVSRTYEYDE